MAQVGDFALLAYDIPGPILWHERLIAAVDPQRPGHAAVLKPDNDHYVETLTLDNTDLQAVRWSSAPGAVPAGVGAGRVYRLRRAVDAAETQR
eukprot:11045673-Alexandrium_andersonii.AAC.1